jgi:hypothetical protein
MRPDCDRVILERPRYRSYARNQKSGARIPLRLADEIEPVSRVPIRRADKELSDFLSPLQRHLRKNVGRPWNKVYSEIREAIDVRSLRGYHFLQHVRAEVGTNPLRTDGFYVHPRSGLLKSGGYT